MESVDKNDDDGIVDLTSQDSVENSSLQGDFTQAEIYKKDTNLGMNSSQINSSEDHIISSMQHS